MHGARPQMQRQLVVRFLAACQSGNLPLLMDLLVQDVTSWSDGGSKGTAARRPIIGRGAVARFWLGLVRKASQKGVYLSATIEEVNGSNAVLLWNDKKLSSILSFVIVDEYIQTFYVIINPEKLKYIQQQMLLL